MKYVRYNTSASRFQSARHVVLSFGPRPHHFRALSTRFVFRRVRLAPALVVGGPRCNGGGFGMGCVMSVWNAPRRGAAARADFLLSRDGRELLPRARRGRRDEVDSFWPVPGCA